MGNLNPNEPPKNVCPSHLGGNNYWPSSYSPRTRLLYIPALSGGRVFIGLLDGTVAAFDESTLDEL